LNIRLIKQPKLKGKGKFPTAEVIADRASYSVALPSGKHKSQYLLRLLMWYSLSV